MPCVSVGQFFLEASCGDFGCRSTFEMILVVHSVIEQLKIIKNGFAFEMNILFSVNIGGLSDLGNESELIGFDKNKDKNYYQDNNHFIKHQNE